jgi:hypothetical protein
MNARVALYVRLYKELHALPVEDQQNSPIAFRVASLLAALTTDEQAEAAEAVKLP